MKTLHYVIIVEVTALPAWLALPREHRGAVVATQIEPARKAHPECAVRWLDAEAMTGRCSDILLVECDDLRAWHHLWEEVRDSDLFAVPYFRLESIVVAAEDAYLDYEESSSGVGAR